MSSVLPKLKVSDVPVEEHQPIKAVGVVQQVETKEIANGFVQVTVPLKYVNPTTGKEDTFFARWNVRPEWFDEGYSAKAKDGTLSESEQMQYNINMSGLTRGVFQAAGLEDMDFDQLQGQSVGFKTKKRKNDPSRGDVSFFYSPSKG